MYIRMYIHHHSIHSYTASQIACRSSLGTSVICTKHLDFQLSMNACMFFLQVVLKFSEEGMLDRHALRYLGRTLSVQGILVRWLNLIGYSMCLLVE